MQKRTGGDKASVVSTAEAYFGLFRDPVVARNTKTSGVWVADLLDESLPPMTLYRNRATIGVVDRVTGQRSE
jgi:hypothetical protein